MSNKNMFYVVKMTYGVRVKQIQAVYFYPQFDRMILAETEPAHPFMSGTIPESQS